MEKDASWIINFKASMFLFFFCDVRKDCTYVASVEVHLNNMLKYCFLLYVNYNTRHFGSFSILFSLIFQNMKISCEN